MNNKDILKFWRTAFCLIILTMASTASAQHTSTTDKMFPNVVFTKDNYQKAIKEIRDNPQGAFASAYHKEIKNPADKIIKENRMPKPVKSCKDNPDNVSIKDEMSAIYQLCVAYALTQDMQYANKAEEFLKEWAKVNHANPRDNIHEEVYTAAIEGYSLIRHIISDSSRTQIDNWGIKRINTMLDNPDLRYNNWGTCLLSQYYIYGYALERSEWVNKVKETYPEWVKHNLYPNGTTQDLMGRDAFAYHAYNLLFYARLCHVKSIYEGYEEAERFYVQDVNWGASIKNSVDFWKNYILDNQKYKHIEFIHTEWDGDKKRGDYNKPYKPGGTIYVLDELYEIDASLLSIITQFRGKSMTWKLALSSLRYL